MEEMVEITRNEYEGLKLSEKFLDALSAAGVDNWDGYDQAIDILNGDT